MKMPWDYALRPLEPPMPHVKLEDIPVPHPIWEALCTRLDEGPASFDCLVLTAKQSGLELSTARLVEQWLEKQKAAGFIELTEGRWQVRGSDTSGEKHG